MKNLGKATEYNITPKKRMKKVFKRVMEGEAVSSAMAVEGYSEHTSRTPKNLTNTKSWQMLLDKALPDPLLLKVHKEGLGATKHTNSFTEPDKEIPDYATRHKYLETSYKIKKKLNDAPNTGIVILQFND